MTSDAHPKEAVLASDPAEWDTSDAPDAFTNPDRNLTLERLGEWTPDVPPWSDGLGDATVRQASYRLFYDREPFDQTLLYAVDGETTLIPEPSYGPPPHDPTADLDGFTFSLNRYQVALGRSVSTEFDAYRERTNLAVRDERFSTRRGP